MFILIPISMIVFGFILNKHCPKDVNSVFGYRTTMSTKNKDTWYFANTKFGKLWEVIGAVLLLICLVVFFLIYKNAEFYNLVIWIMGIQCTIMLLPIIFIEKELNRLFDKSGKRK